MPISILAHTPFWAWAILAFLIRRGIVMRRRRVVAPETLLILPVILFVLSLARLGEAHFAMSAVVAVVLGGGAGVGLAGLLKPARGTRRLETGRLEIQGEWVSLPLLLLIYLVNYAYNVALAVAPDGALVGGLALACMAVTGGSTGLVAGRAVAHLAVGRERRAEDVQGTVG